MGAKTAEHTDVATGVSDNDTLLQAPDTPTQADRQLAKTYSEKFREIPPMLTDSGFRASFNALKANVSSIFKNNGWVSPSDDQVDALRKTVLDWRHGPAGQTMAKIESRILSILRGIRGSQEKPGTSLAEMEVAESGVVMEFEFGGTIGMLRRAMSYGVLLNGRRNGTVSVTQLFGLQAQLIGLSMGTALSGLLDTADLGGWSCAVGVGFDVGVLDAQVAVSFAMPEHKFDGVSFALDAEAAIPLGPLAASYICGNATEVKQNTADGAQGKAKKLQDAHQPHQGQYYSQQHPPHYYNQGGYYYPAEYHNPAQYYNPGHGYYPHSVNGSRAQ